MVSLVMSLNLNWRQSLSDSCDHVIKHYYKENWYASKLCTLWLISLSLSSPDEYCIKTVFDNHKKISFEFSRQHADCRMQSQYLANGGIN